MTVFWDTNLFIYLFEKHPTFGPRVLSLYRRHREAGVRVATSTLTLGELVAQPKRLHRADLVRAYTSFLAGGTTLRLVIFDVVAAEHYAVIRAETNLRQPNAIQMACAIATGASIFYTNDKRLWGMQVPGIMQVCGLEEEIVKPSGGNE